MNKITFSKRSTEPNRKWELKLRRLSTSQCVGDDGGTFGTWSK